MVRLAMTMMTRPTRVAAAQVTKIPRWPSTVREPTAMIGPDTMAPSRRVFR